MYFSLVVLTAFFSASFIQAEQLETLRNDVCRGIVKLAIKMRCDLVDENSILEDEVDNTEANNRAHLCDIVHLITEDDTCDSIAESHNLTLDVFNSSNVDCDNLKVGKSICLLNLNISEPESNANQTDDNSTDQEIDDSFTTQSEDETSESDNYDSDYESESDDYADESVGYTTTVKQTTTKATTTTAKPVPVMNAVNKDGLMAHNYYRRKHGVSPLQYDAGLAKYAQEWADYLAQTGTMKHRSQNKYGENLAMASGKDLTGIKIFFRVFFTSMKNDCLIKKVKMRRICGTVRLKIIISTQARKNGLVVI